MKADELLTIEQSPDLETACFMHKWSIKIKICLLCLAIFLIKTAQILWKIQPTRHHPAEKETIQSFPSYCRIKIATQFH